MQPAVGGACGSGHESDRDFDTFRRRAAGEKESAQHSGKRTVLLTLLPVLDTLERALATGSTDPHFYESVAATFRLFTSTLLEVGAEPFDSVGQRFDPTVHEAIETIHGDSAEPGAGYTLSVAGLATRRRPTSPCARHRRRAKR